MYWIYNICLVAYWLLQIPILIYRLVFEEGFYDRLKQSAGVMPTPTLQQIAYHNAIWVHAASVGEVVAASPIVRELKKKYPDEMVVVSVVTATGHRMAQRIIPEADGHIFFPFDLPVITERIVDIVNPKAIILIETELWPNFLRLAFRKKIPVMMMNGRISSRSMRRYSLIKRFTTRMLCQIRRFCMQSRIDEERIIAMGAQPKRCTITGNTKYDQTYAEVSEEERAALRKEFRFDGKGPIIVAGSTHSGEEEIVLRTFGEILKKYPKARLLLAVREITRAPSVKFAIKHHGYSVLRRSKMGTEEDDGTSPQVVILDTIGELGRLYSLADVVFVGGSFVKVGGHNILEPAAHGKPVIGFVDRTDGGVNDGDADLFALDGLQGLYERFDGALDIRFDDNVEFLHFAFLDLFEDVVKGDLLDTSLFLFLRTGCADLSDISSLLFIHDKEVVAGFRHAVHAEDLDRDRRFRTLHLAAVFIVHRTDAAPALAGQDAVTDMEGTVLDKDAHDRASAFIQLGFDDDAVCFAVRIGLELLHFSDEEDVFQKIIEPDLLLRGDRCHDDIAAPVFSEQAFFGELFLDAVRVGARFIDLVDRDHDRYTGILRVMDRFDGLRHDAVIGCYDEDSDIGQLRAAGAHRGKGFMARGIEEGDLVIFITDLVCTDALGDAAGFVERDIRLTKGIEQGGLAMVNVAHHSHHWWT